MSASTTCPVCRQLVAVDARGIAPHTRYGKPCDGGRPAPALRPPSAHVSVNEARRVQQATRRAARDAKDRAMARSQAAANREEAERQREQARAPRLAGMNAVVLASVAREERRRERVEAIRAALPATAHDVAALFGVTVASMLKALGRAGAVHVGKEPQDGLGVPRVVWGLPEAAAEAAK